jgi:F0F1-type ATP synthase epsilon subunit
MFPPLTLQVRTPEGVLLSVSGVRQVQAQLADGGGIGILPGHGPLLAETIAGPLEYTDPYGVHSVSVDAGVLSVEDGHVTIYTSGHHAAD